LSAQHWFERRRSLRSSPRLRFSLLLTNISEVPSRRPAAERFAVTAHGGMDEYAAFPMLTDPHSAPTAFDRGPGAVADRRHATAVRERFEEALELLSPFFDPANQWQGRSFELLAMRQLREHFEGLGGSEIVVMFEAVRRLHETRRRPAPYGRP
jgi:hypothetical protein